MKKISYIALCGAAFALCTTNAQASGYQLNEFSAVNLGRAFAGVGVVGDDYSAIAFNPAGMLLKDTGMQVGVSAVQMHSDVKGALYYGGTPIKSKPDGKVDLYKILPHFFAQKKVNDDLAIGLGVFTPFGLATDYNKYWFGARHGTKTELEVVDISPTIAYRVMDKLSIGAGWVVRYVHGDVRNDPTGNGSENKMDLDGWSANSWSLGAMYEHSENTRIGVSYRYNNAHTVKGAHRVKGTGTALDGLYDGRSKMTLPSTFTLSGYHKIDPKFGLSAAARWTKWNVFDNFVMTSSSGRGASIPEKWDNIWTYSLGLDYYCNDNLTLRTGVAYDRAPIKKNKYRTVRIPDSDRYWITAGVSYKTEKFQYDLGYSHLFMKEAKSDNFDNGTTAKAKFHNYSNMFGIQVQYNF